ncbi:MAG: electron transport complex subunit RsxE [Clostridium fessum]
MNKYVERLYNGIWKENPIFVQMLGLCPTLAVTTSAINGVGMGLSTTAVLIAANFLIALLRKIIPDGVRLPAEIVVVASFVTIVDMLMEGFVPSLYASIGLYIPLIVVNCIILGRAEAYAMKNGPILSAFDGIGMGLGFTVALALIGSFRELLGAGTIFGIQIMPASYQPISIFIHSAGCILRTGLPDCSSESSEDAVCNKRFRKEKKKGGCCSGDCLSCAGHDAEVKKEQEEK